MMPAGAQPQMASKVLIGCRAGDPKWRPIAGSQPRPCSECAHDVMVSLASLARIESGEVEHVLCAECAVEAAKRRGTPWLEAPRDDAQRAELIANGYADKPLAFPNIEREGAVPPRK